MAINVDIEVYDGIYQHIIIDVRNVAAADMGTPYVLAITDGTNTFTITCSVHSYIKAVLLDDEITAKLQNTVKAMYAYGQAAAAYFP